MQAPLLGASHVQQGAGARSSGALGGPAWAKWYVLAVYSYISAQQSLLWITWSSVPAPSKEFLCIDSAPPGNISSCTTTDSTLNLFLDEGPIAYCCVVTLAAWLLSRPNGLRLSIVIGASMCFFASVIRSVPALFALEFRAAHPWLTLAFTHLGQTTNAAVAPLVVASPAFLSLTWFPVTQRNTATSIANVANALGRAVGLYLGPAMVPAATNSPTSVGSSSGNDPGEPGAGERRISHIPIVAPPMRLGYCRHPDLTVPTPHIWNGGTHDS
jgi:hypothetical protein